MSGAASCFSALAIQVLIHSGNHNTEAEGFTVDEGPGDIEGDGAIGKGCLSGTTFESRGAGDIVAVKEIPEVRGILILEVEDILLRLCGGTFDDNMEMDHVFRIFFGEVVDVVGDILNMAVDHKVYAILHAGKAHLDVIGVNVPLGTVGLIGRAVVKQLVVTNIGGGRLVFVLAAGSKEHRGGSHKHHDSIQFHNYCFLGEYSILHL